MGRGTRRRWAYDHRGAQAQRAEGSAKASSAHFRSQRGGFQAQQLALAAGVKQLDLSEPHALLSNTMRLSMRQRVHRSRRGLRAVLKGVSARVCVHV
jgi:hypothetical protein